MKKTLTLLIILFSFIRMQAQPGCTDPQASNYNAAATSNDGSCVYPATSLPLQLKASLATPTLDETSGIEFIAGSLWTHNDSGNSPSLYRVDSATGAVLQTVAVSNATNVDWEDIASGPDYLYVGDFGNNNGNRTDLKIYRIAKSALTPGATSVMADIINFSYSDQISFVSAPNNNNFDCESVIFYNDSLHLFSKDWVDKMSRHYVLPATPGTYIAQVKETLNAGNLVTGATVQEGGVIALIGYDKSGLFPVSIWMLYDHHGGLFYNGNKRKFSCSTMLINGQTEGIDFKNGGYGYVSNERLQQNPVNIAPTIKTFDLGPYLPAWFINPAPVADFTVSNDTICKGASVQFTDLSMQNPIAWNWSFPGGSPSFSTQQHPVVTYSTAGIYSVTLLVSNSGGGLDTLTRTNFIKVVNPPQATVTPAGPLIFCTGGSVTLNANAGSGFTYQWKKNGNLIAGAAASSYVAASTGTYKAIVTNSTGCSKASAGIAVTGPPSATITAGGPLSFCAGDSVTLTASNGAGYSWQWKRNGANINGATGITLVAKTAGAYKVTVTNAFACSKVSASKNVTVTCRESAGMPGTQLYPNPAENELRIETNDPDLADADILIYAATGQLVKRIRLHGSFVSVDVSDMQAGLYQVRLTGKNGTSELQKLVKY